MEGAVPKGNPRTTGPLRRLQTSQGNLGARVLGSVCLRRASTTQGWGPQQVNSLHTCRCLSAQMGPPPPPRRFRRTGPNDTHPELGKRLASLSYSNYTQDTADTWTPSQSVGPGLNTSRQSLCKGRLDTGTPHHTRSISHNPLNPSEAKRITEMIGPSTGQALFAAVRLSEHPQGARGQRQDERWMRPQPSSSGKRKEKQEAEACRGHKEALE